MNLLTSKQVCEKISSSRSYLYDLIKADPTFPKPVYLKAGDKEKRASAPRWKDFELDKWIEKKGTSDDDSNNANQGANDNSGAGTAVHQAP